MAGWSWNAADGLLHSIGSETNPMFAIPFGWHIVIGGWAFGMVFMATDPSMSRRKGTVYGFFIGVMASCSSCDPVSEGMMLAFC